MLPYPIAKPPDFKDSERGKKIVEREKPDRIEKGGNGYGSSGWLSTWLSYVQSGKSSSLEPDPKSQCNRQ